MAKKSKSKSKSTKAVVEPEDPKSEAVNDQEEHQAPSALAESFDQSAAFFGKKASYTPAISEEAAANNTHIEKKEKEKKVNKEKKVKKEKKKEKVMKETQESEHVQEKEEQEDKKKAEADQVETEDGEKKKKTKNKKNITEDGDEEQDEKENTPDDEKGRRTVFVGNVSLDATPKDIKKYFAVCGKVEIVRRRQLPIAGCAVGEAGNQKLMMKVCANKKILTTAKDNCNAYVRFVEEKSVDAAVKLNGTTLVGKKIRVDRCKHVIEAHRSIFLGNVPFNCTDDKMLQLFTKRLKSEEEPEPIENIRLFRDRESGLGKGFGFLLLKTPALVAKTLTLRNLKIGDRELRVGVCGKRFKNLRGKEPTKKKFEGLHSSAGARARIHLKRKNGAVAHDQGLTTKKMKRVAAEAGLGKKLKPKHAARKAAKAAEEAAAAISGKTSNKRKHDHVDSKKVTTPKPKKPKHASRKAKQAAAKE